MTSADTIYSRGIRTVLVTVVVLVVAAELFTRLFLGRISKIERRELDEIAALHNEPPPAGARRVLVVGNSLLRAGVDFPGLTRALQPAWDAKRLIIESTDFYDWYYGLRRLLREGVRLDAVVVMLSPQQLSSSTVRGDYFARRLMTPGDVFAVGRDAHIPRTQQADMALSSVSEFYGMRSEIRKVILGRMIPSLPNLMTQLAPPPTWDPDQEKLFRMASVRLKALRDLLGPHAVPLLLVMPPLPNSLGSAAIVRAGIAANVPVLVPIPSGTLPLSSYSDGFHLNDAGAAQFTAALTQALHDALPPKGSVVVR